MAQTDEMVPVLDIDALVPGAPVVVQAQGQAIALFAHNDEVYAVDNRCPHMGFPLSEGSVEDGILTCHWHHARFELEQGDTFDIWADDVQTYPVEVDDGQVFVHPNPEPDVPPATHWRNRLADGLQENLSLVMAKAVIGLDEQAEGFITPIETAVNFGTKYRDMGWGRGLTTLSCAANLYTEVSGRDKRRAMVLGVREVADETRGEAPRFGQYAFDSQNIAKPRLKAWFRENCEVRDETGAERVLLTALANLPREAVAEMMFAGATDHLYMNGGHTLDFLNKAFEILEHIGWEDHADSVLASVIPQITDGSRSEERSSWRNPVDVAELCFDAADLLPSLVAAGDDKEWTRPESFVETLLGDDPEVILESLTEAIRAGATQTQLANAVARAATHRIAYFGTSNEFADWDTAHHTLSYANAVHRATAKTNGIELYRACFDGAMSVYLDRFLNTPAAPVPQPGDSETSRSPTQIREDLQACFDEQGRVNRAGQLVDEHFEVGGDPAELKRVLGHDLLREDADFHTIQNVEAGVQRFDAVDQTSAASTSQPSADGDKKNEHERRLALIAPARYLAAHTPTRREAEQTFGIATRLHRGERLHETE
jgi:nitrite reductase/ring-hydroxylating ferredoxin subunit